MHVARRRSTFLVTERRARDLRGPLHALLREERDVRGDLRVVAESGRLRLTREASCWLKGRIVEGIGLEKTLSNVEEDLRKSSGRPPEDLLLLAPRPKLLLMRRDPQKFRPNIAKIQQNSFYQYLRKFWQKIHKISRKN